MQLAKIALVLAFAASAMAYLVNTPNGNEGRNWKAHGPQPLAWTTVDTDPKVFNVVLVRQQPPFSKLIATDVYGPSLSTYIDPPKGGFPIGEHFRVNLVKGGPDSDIYAQSNEFTISN